MYSLFSIINRCIRFFYFKCLGFKILYYIYLNKKIVLFCALLYFKYILDLGVCQFNKLHYYYYYYYYYYIKQDVMQIFFIM